MRHFAKALTPSEQAKLDSLRSSVESRIRDAIDLLLKKVRSDSILRLVLRLLEIGDYASVLRVVDESVLTASEVLSDVFKDVAQDVVLDVSKELLKTPPTVVISFNPDHPEAVALMRRNKLEFVREFTRKQRIATRTVLAEALRTGVGPIEAARLVRVSLGLTAHQQASVVNYRRLLEMGSREALDRDLRDRRFDRTVARASEGNRPPLTQEQIDRMVTRYHERFLMYRSEVIARTETTKVLSQARHNAVRQVMEQAGFKDNQVRRTWNTSLDGRERPTHHDMNAQEVIGMNSYYTSPSGAKLRYPGDPSAPAQEVIQCRCVETFRFS